MHDLLQVSVAFDETTTIGDVDALLAVLNGGSAPDFTAESLASSVRRTTMHHDRSVDADTGAIAAMIAV